MIKADPILAVKDVEKTANWYQQVFGFKKIHGGNEFAVLTSDSDEIILCLHKWGEHHHPTLTDSEAIPGNGLLLYFRTDNMALIRKNIEKIDWPIEEELHLNPNSLTQEFSVRDPNGYFLTITEFHRFEG